MKTLEIQHLVKKFPQSQRPAVDGVSFAVENGEILALVGPSGCGKTTTLRLIAGLERPDAGEICLNEQLVAGAKVFVPPERRSIGMVFQDHALFPHLTVAENIAFGLRGRSRREVTARVDEMLTLVELTALARRYPHELSGGERQRVAVARSLAPNPALALLDEPFSSLDADLRLEVREQVRAILKGMRATTVFVTHDQDEALYMGDRLAVFRYGRIEQVGAPEDVFHAARTRFVAEFMGAGEFLVGELGPGGVQTELGPLPQPAPKQHLGPVDVALRADDVDFEPAENGNAVIIERFFRGAFNLYRLRLHSGQLLHAYKEHTQIYPVGTLVRAFISAGHPLALFQGERALPE